MTNNMLNIYKILFTQTKNWEGKGKRTVCPKTGKGEEIHNNGSILDQKIKIEKSGIAGEIRKIIHQSVSEIPGIVWGVAEECVKITYLDLDYYRES